MADPRPVGISLKQAINLLGLQPSQRSQLHLSRLASFLRNQDGFFSALSHADAEVVSKWLGYEYVFPAQPVYKQGDFGESMYIIIGGACEYAAPKDSPSSQCKGSDQPLVVGQSFGETALVAPRRPRSRTVIASQETDGAHLVTINRSALSSLRFMGAAQVDASQALQSILAACCLGPLRQPPGSRSTEDVEILTELMTNMDAFKKLPKDMVRRLAADCAHVRVPAGRVLFEEDAPGNSMYAVVSGQCQVRARPLRSKAGAGNSRSVLRPGSLGIGMTMTPRKMLTSGLGSVSGGVGGGGGSGTRSLMESTPQSLASFGSPSVAAVATEAPAGAAVAPAAMAAASGGGGGGGGKASTMRSGERWRTAGPGTGGDDDDDIDEVPEEAQHQRAGGPAKPPAAAVSRRSSGSSNNKDSPFWIARFMEDTLKRLHLSDSSAGLGQQMTPLAAVAAARWRHATSGRRSSVGTNAEGTAPASTTATAVEEDSPDGEEEGMEALLGRAAARALREAVSEQRARKGHNYGHDHDAEHTQDHEGVTGVSMDTASVNTDAGMASRASRPATATAALRVPPLTPPPPLRLSNDGKSGSNDGSSSTRSCTSISGSVEAVSPMAAAGATAATTPAAAAAASPHLGPTQVVAVEDPAKRLLSKIGVRDPSNVSRTLLAELVQRADVGVVLYEVAKRLVKRGGGPRRINQHTSKKINRVLHYQIRAGPDHLQETLQGQKVLGRHSTVTSSRASTLWTKGPGASVLVSGHIPNAGHHNQQHPVIRHSVAAAAGGGMSAAMGTATAAGAATGIESTAVPTMAMVPAVVTAGALGPGSIWGESTSVQGSQNPRSSVNFAPGTRPGSALTSGVSGYVDFEGEFADDVSDVDWTSSDLYSLASHGNGIRRMTGGDLDLNNLVSTENLTPGELDSMYGTVIRKIAPGQSFGELALLHRDSRRTATVITGDAPVSNPSLGPSHAPDQSVDLICITRHIYNHTVRASQVNQLQGLLSFLARLSPFRGLDDQQRTSLAVFCRQREVAAGAVLAIQGEPADTLWMVLEGEVVLLDNASSVVEPLKTRPAALRPPVRRFRSQNLMAAIVGSGGDGNGNGNDGGGGGGGRRKLTRQMSAPESGFSSAGPGGLRSLMPSGPSARKDPSAGRKVMFVSGTLNHGGGGGGAGGGGSSGASSLAAGSADGNGQPRHVSPAALLSLGGVLTAMGPGGIFGEGLLMTGSAAPQTQTQQQAPLPPPLPPLPHQLLQHQPHASPQLQLMILQQHLQQSHLQAQQQQHTNQQSSQQTTPATEEDEVSRGRKARGRGPAPLVPPPYPFTVIARRATRLLTISANDLGRFADVVAAPLAELAASRAEFLAGRVASVSAAKEAVSERVNKGRRVLRVLRIAQDTEAYPGLEDDLRLAEEESAAEAAAAAAEAAASAPLGQGAFVSSLNAGRTSIGSPAGLTTPGVQGSSQNLPPGAVLPAPGRTVVLEGGVLRINGGTNVLRDLAVRYVEGDRMGDISLGLSSSMRSLSGRKSAQLLPAGLLRRLQSRHIGTATAAAAAAAAALEEVLRGGGGGVSTLFAAQPHPAAGRLEALLSDSTPQLPEAFPPPRDDASGEDRSPLATPMPLAESPGGGAREVASGASGGGGRSLSTIAEESSTALRGTAAQHLDNPPSSAGGDLSVRRNPRHDESSNASLRGQDTYTGPVGLTFGPWITADPDPNDARELDTTNQVTATSLRDSPNPWVTPDPQQVNTGQHSSYGGAVSSYRTPTVGSGFSGITTSEEEEDGGEEELGLPSALDDPYFDSLGTVEEGDEEAALAERSEELAVSAGRGGESWGVPVDNTRRLDGGGVDALLSLQETAEVQEALSPPQRSSLPRLPSFPLSGQSISPVSSGRPSASGATLSLPLPLPPLRLPSATSSSRRRPHSSCGLPTAGELAATATAAQGAASYNSLPPHVPLRLQRRGSLPPSVPPIVPHLRLSGSQLTVSSSTIQSYYTDISLSAITGIPAATVSNPPAETAASAAVAAAAAPSAPHHRRPQSAGAAGGGSSSRTPIRGDSFGSEGLSASGSLVIYTDDGSTSPDLSNIRFETSGSKHVVLPPPILNRRALGSQGFPFPRPMLRSPATSNFSEGLVPLSGFTSGTSSVVAGATAVRPPGIQSEDGSQSGSGSGYGYGYGYEYGYRSGYGFGVESRSELETGSGDGVLEIQRASPDSRRAESRQVRQTMWRPTMAGSDGRSVDSGSATGSGRSSSSSTTVQMPLKASALHQAAMSEKEPDMRYALSPTSFEAAAGAAAGAGAGAAALPATGAGNADAEASQLFSVAPAASSAIEKAAAATAVPSSTVYTDAAAAPPPILPWSNTSSRAPIQLPTTASASLPPSSQTREELSPPLPWSPPATEATAAELAMLPKLPPLTLAALRRHLASEDGDVLGSGPQSCSPRAALTDSPLRSQRHHAAGLVDSPVHSPRVLSRVY